MNIHEQKMQELKNLYDQIGCKAEIKEKVFGNIVMLDTIASKAMLLMTTSDGVQYLRDTDYHEEADFVLFSIGYLQTSER